MSIWEKMGFGGYKGFSRESDHLLRSAVELAGDLGCEKADTGHLLLVGLDVKNAMIELGDRITAFHVHDNDGAHDQHLAPYMGVLDWNRFVEGLKAIGYNKTMSFETFNIWNVMDEEIAPKMMKFIAECGRTFARRAEA